MKTILMLHDGTETSNLLRQALENLKDGGCDLRLETALLGRPKGFKLESGCGIKEFLGDPDEVVNNPALTEADILLAHLSPITGAAINRAGNLKLIGCARSSAANIDVPVATARRIPVVACPGRNARAVAEFTMALILSACRRVPQAERAMRGGGWGAAMKRGEFTGPELEGRTLGLIGYGAIGRMVAGIARAFGMRVLFYDPGLKPGPMADCPDEQVPLEVLLRTADIISLHARAREAGGEIPPPIIGADELALMKASAYLVNTARGHLVDEAALIAALREKKLAGAGLDTFAVEPLPADSPLFTLPNVVMTPHVAGNSTDQAARSAKMLSQRVERFIVEGIAGLPVLENPEVRGSL